MELEWILIFSVSTAIIVYTYFGYGLLLKYLVRNRKTQLPKLGDDDLPYVTHIVTAYNEERCIEEKIKNCLMIDYPMDKIHTIIITDGSTDATSRIVANNPRVQLMYKPARAGKLEAMARAIRSVTTPITIFSDANAMINAQGIKNLAQHFQNNRVGAVAGEKKVAESSTNASQGESLYWRYESWLKQMDAQLHTVVGAAGELWAIRTHLFKKPEPCIIEDFVLTVALARDGFRVAYEPTAYAMETGSANVAEELKRKVRISAGGLQACWRLAHVLNPFRYGTLAFQLFSHRFLRWTLAPLSLLLLFISSIALSMSGEPLFVVASALQIAFYVYATLGYCLEQVGKRIRFGLPIFYFTFMNISVFLGLLFLARNKEMICWEKSERA